MKTKRAVLVALLLMGASFLTQAQIIPLQPIKTAVPFVSYSPDAKGSALGNCGVATSPDAFSMYYNPAKYAFMQNEHTMIASGFNLFSSNSTVPFLIYSAFAQKIGKSAIAATARYYSMGGEIDFVDEYNQSLGSYRPSEFAIDVAYAYRFGEYLSAGVAGRFIHSNLIIGMGNKATSYSIAGDVSVYYKRPLCNLVDMSLGTSITNIGTKMSYNPSSVRKSFIPTTLRLGTAFKFNFHPKNTLTVNLEFSKLLVPTPPIRDESGILVYGRDDNVSVFRGMIQSFYDAPGYALNLETYQLDHVGTFYQELCEITTGVGLEYNLADHFYARCGFYHAPNMYRGINCFTQGLGMHFGIFGMDVSYSLYFSSNAYVYDSSLNRSFLRWDMYFAF